MEPNDLQLGLKPLMLLSLPLKLLLLMVVDKLVDMYLLPMLLVARLFMVRGGGIVQPICSILQIL